MDTFKMGFDRALALWRAGETTESISQRPEYDASAYGRGMFAACEAILGWYDIAEREAIAFGFHCAAARALCRSVDNRG